MNRSDERKQTNASMARSPAEARRRTAPNVIGSVSDEADGGEIEEAGEGEGSSMARSAAAAKRGAEKHASEEREEQAEGKAGHAESIKGGREIMRETVEADHVIGTGGRVGTSSAEGHVDGESAKAERKEAMEPERAASENAAMGRERDIATKHTMGWGERETVAKHTI